MHIVVTQKSGQEKQLIIFIILAPKIDCELDLLSLIWNSHATTANILFVDWPIIADRGCLGGAYAHTPPFLKLIHIYEKLGFRQNVIIHNKVSFIIISGKMS